MLCDPTVALFSSQPVLTLEGKSRGGGGKSIPLLDFLALKLFAA